MKRLWMFLRQAWWGAWHHYEPLPPHLRNPEKTDT
jgi:hypothetical protein